MKAKLLLVPVLIITAGIASAQTRQFTLVALPGMVNHWPGPSGHVGTSDDVVSGNPSNIYGSLPNSQGAFSYNAFDFSGDGSLPDAALLPPPMNAVTFLSGTVSANLDAGEGKAIIANWSVSGTEPFQGHGPYTAEIVRVDSGTYNPLTGAFSQIVDFRASLMAGTADSVSFEFSGTAFIVQASQYASGIGHSYVDTVLIPAAQALEAGSFFFARGSGIVPASSGGTGGGFPQMPVLGVLFGIAGPGDMEAPVLGARRAGGNVELHWSADYPEYSLVGAATLTPPIQWEPVPQTRETVGGEFVVTIASPAGERFFRLRRAD